MEEVFNLYLKRHYLGPRHTIGKLYLKDKYFCDTLEDKVRALTPEDPKVPEETAIPPGTYEVTLTHSCKFKRVLPLLLDVPSFEGIRIHSGNTIKDTQGCILVGKNTEVGKVTNSRYWETKLIKELSKIKSRIFITVV